MKNCLGSAVSPSQAEEEPTNSAQYNPKEETSVLEEFQHCDQNWQQKDECRELKILLFRLSFCRKFSRPCPNACEQTDGEISMRSSGSPKSHTSSHYGELTKLAARCEGHSDSEQNKQWEHTLNQFPKCLPIACITYRGSFWYNRYRD
jgi:hypothetical protein